MKKIILLFVIFCSINGIAQLPGKLDSLISVYEKLKDDTLKVERFLFLATESSAIDTTLSGSYGRRAYALALKIKDIKGQGNSFNYFGRMHYQVQNYDKAIICFEKAAQYFEQCNFLKGSASALNNCGVIYNEKGDFDHALEFQKKSLEANIKSKNEEGVGNNYLNMGNTLNLRGDFKEAMTMFLKAETIYNKLNKWESLATAYYNIAYVLYNLKQYDKAIQYCEKSLKLREEKTFNKIGMAYNHVFLASVYSDTVRLDLNKANYHYKKVIKLCQETGDRITLLSSYINISKIYCNQGNLDTALSYSMKSLALSKELGNQKFMVSSFYSVGDVLMKLNKSKEALLYFNEGYNLSDSIGDESSLCNNAQGMALCYYESGKYKDAYDYLLIYTKKKDQMYSKDNLQAISEMEAKYEAEKKELQIKNQSLEIDAQEKQNKQKSLIILFGTLALVGTGFFATMAFINFKKAKKANVIIENQKLEVELKNEEITHQKDLVEEKQKEIIDSINYAKRIQQAVLTGEDVWDKISKEHFILFKPKDIVSGDFYWAYNTPNNRSVFALADCTGHGVPGGFMSMLGNSFLNEIVVENKIFKANEILNKLRSKIINALEQKGGTQQKDGMDMCLCVWNKLDNTLEFAGANNPLWLLRTVVSSNGVENKQLIEYKADKMPIGLYLETETPFTSVTIQLQAGDVIYLSTDGYADQFGGPKGKKLKYKPLIESLIKNSQLDMAVQKTNLETAFNDWKGSHEQVDDVSIIAVKVLS